MSGGRRRVGVMVVWMAGLAALWLLAAAWPFGGLFAAAAEQPVLALNDHTDDYDLQGYLAVLEDPSLELTVEEVDSVALSGQFTIIDQIVPSFGFTDSAYWIRLRLRNETDETNDWRLEMPNATVDEVTYFHHHEDGSIHTHATGAAFATSTRDLPAPGFAFQMTIEPGQDETIYLRVHSKELLTVPLRLMSVGGYVQHRALWDSLWGVVFGIYAVLGGYQLIQSLQLRDSSHLALATLGIFTMLVYIFSTGYGDLYLLPDRPLLLRTALPVGFAINSASVNILMRQLLQTKVRAPRLDRLMRLLLIPTLVLPVLLLLANPVVLALVLVVIYAATYMAGAAATIVVRRQNYRPAEVLLQVMPVAIAMGIAAPLTQPFLTGLDWTFPLIIALLGIVLLLMLGRAVDARIAVLRSERRAAEQALALERARYQLILDDQINMICRLDPMGTITFVNRAILDFFGRDDVALLGAGVFDIIPDPAGVVVNEALARIAAGEPFQVFDVELGRGDGQFRWTRWYLRAVYDERGALAEYQATGNDVTDELRYAVELERYRGHLKELVDERTAELARQRAIASGLEQNASILNSSLDFETVSRAILDQIRVVRSCDGAAMLLPEGDRLVAVAGSGLSRLTQGRSLLIGDMRTPSMQSFVGGSPILYGDTMSYPDWPGHGEPDKVRCLLSVPMRRHDATIGTLTIVSRTPHAFQPEDADLLQAYANHAALAVINARLYERSKIEAATEERERLARELHDSVTQALFSAGILAEAAPLQLQADLDRGLQSVDKLRRLTRGALGEMRTMLVELRPDTLATIELGTLLGYLADAATARSRIHVQVSIDQDVPALPPEVHVAFYRVAQEALTNITRVSGAQHASLTLVDERDGICLMITDDGRGFDPATDAPASLVTMRERAESIGARLTVESAPGAGCAVRMLWAEEDAAAFDLSS